jgi:LPS-assembly protein
MSFKTKQIVVLLSVAVLQTAVASQANITAKDKQPLDYAKVLGWVAQPNNPYNLSGGYYVSHRIPYVANPLLKSQKHNVDISANSVTYSTKGTSELSGDVQISRPGQELKAGKALLYRSSKSGKVEKVKLYNNVRLITPNEMLVGRYGELNLKKNSAKLYNTAYRNIPKDQPGVVVKKNATTTKHYGLVYWGHAKEVEKVKPGLYRLKGATYTTCPPTKQCIWHLHATTVNINTKKQVGSAWNSTLDIKGVPVFYYPYISFPLNKKRKSGFLSPYYSTSDKYGAKLAVPFYWNIAPNYDALFTLNYMTERGLMVTPLFRYLTATSSGKLKLSILPYDKEFASFKDSAKTAAKYASQPVGLKDLQNDSATRYSVDFDNSTQLDKNWSALIDYSRVSDPYFRYDLGSGLVNDSNNQLLQKGQVKYRSAHWNFFGLLQSYQTLHLVTQQQVDNQYARLPELDGGASYPDFYDNFSFSFNSSATRFFNSNAPDQTGPEPVIGNRYTLTPALDYAFIRPYGYLTPQAQLQMTSYSLQREGALPANTGEVLPILDLRGGLNFTKDFSWAGSQYEETLIPHFYYLYVPYHNQDELPIFDTSTQPFNYNFMFLDNRFTGVDRIGDANQVTYALTSQLINRATGTVKGSVSIGQIFYFKNRDVLLCSGHDCGVATSMDKHDFSPIAGQANYNFNSQWSATAALTWNTYKADFSYQNAAVTYRSKTNKQTLLNVGYDFVKSGDVVSGQPENGAASGTLRQFNISGSWGINKHWDALAQWSYSWSNSQASHANAYLAGVQYNASCWGIRFVAARSFIGISNTNNAQFQNAFYLQFDLHGLGSVGNDDATGLLNSSISGYDDDAFGQAITG